MISDLSISYFLDFQFQKLFPILQQANILCFLRKKIAKIFLLVIMYQVLVCKSELWNNFNPKGCCYLKPKQLKFGKTISAKTFQKNHAIQILVHTMYQVQGSTWIFVNWHFRFNFLDEIINKTVEQKCISKDIMRWKNYLILCSKVKAVCSKAKISE